MSEGTAGDVLRLIIIVQAFWMAGQSAWYFQHTVWISWRLILICMTLVSLGAIASLVSNRGEPPNWGHPLLMSGYGIGLYGLQRWRIERMTDVKRRSTDQTP